MASNHSLPIAYFYTLVLEMHWKPRWYWTDCIKDWRGRTLTDCMVLARAKREWWAWSLTLRNEDERKPIMKIHFYKVVGNLIKKLKNKTIKQIKACIATGPYSHKKHTWWIFGVIVNRLVSSLLMRNKFDSHCVQCLWHCVFFGKEWKDKKRN